MTPRNIYLIGPGGAGKSTAGKLLAAKLSRVCIDLDSEFMERVGPIQEFIPAEGYAAYCRANLQLFADLLCEKPTGTVFVLSSGFFAYDREILPEYGALLARLNAEELSISLLPSEDPTETERIIVERQLARGHGLNRDKEIQKIRERFPIYRAAGRFQLFCSGPPEEIAERMREIVAQSD